MEGSSVTAADAESIAINERLSANPAVHWSGVYQMAMHRLAAVALQLALNDCLLIWGRRITELLSPQGERRGMLIG